MATDDDTALRSDVDVAALAAWEHARNPTAATAYRARVSCARVGLDYLAMLAVCQRRSEDLVQGPVDADRALEEVARALSRASDRVRR